MPSPINWAVSNGNSNQLQQNGKGVIQNVNQDGKHSLQQLADSYRDHNQRHDDEVLDADGGRAFRYGASCYRAHRAKVACWFRGRQAD